jgi:hypothetical protein
MTVKPRRRYWLDKYKCSKGCEICGYNEQPVALHFDHKYPSEKKRAIAHMMDYKLTNLINEIRKCRILCANCHYIETDKERRE